jgi:hypothetical protein
MIVTTLSPSCPQCGAQKIVYSCEPKCCFNHVCGACRASFQLETRELGDKLSQDAFPNDLPEIESCLPTAQCANCESLRVYQVTLPESTEIRFACADCQSLLELVLAENEDD